mmetsp:Transcript_23334/g.81328  ORF Transcript_23334/g.81328 Transcript_23334/m.81328 type:complete len:654 (+) Transcript_23334:441-2402(+)
MGCALSAAKAKVGPKADPMPNVYAPKYEAEIMALGLRKAEYDQLLRAWDEIMDKYWAEPRKYLKAKEARESRSRGEGSDDDDILADAKKAQEKQKKKDRRRGSKAKRRGSGGAAEEVTSPGAVESGSTPRPDRLKLQWFIDHTGMERSPFSVRAFAVMDLDAKGSISFSQFLKGVWNIASFNEGQLQLWLFGVYDLDSRGYIELEELPAIMKEVYGDAKRKIALQNDIMKYAEEISVKVDKMKILPPDRFLELNRRMPSFLMPAFRFQTYLREAICGTPFWKKAMERREYRMSKAFARYKASMATIGLTPEGFAVKGDSWIGNDMANLVTPEQRANSLVRYVLHIGENLQGMTYGKVKLSDEAHAAMLQEGYDLEDEATGAGGKARARRRSAAGRHTVTIAELLGPDMAEAAIAALKNGTGGREGAAAAAAAVRKLQKQKEAQKDRSKAEAGARGGAGGAARAIARRRSEPEPKHKHLLDDLDGSGGSSMGDGSDGSDGSDDDLTPAQRRAAKLKQKRTAGARQNRFSAAARRKRSKSVAGADDEAEVAAASSDGSGRSVGGGRRPRSSTRKAAPRRSSSAAGPASHPAVKQRPRSASMATSKAITKDMSVEEAMFHTKVAMKGRNAAQATPSLAGGRRGSKATPVKRRRSVA